MRNRKNTWWWKTLSFLFCMLLAGNVSLRAAEPILNVAADAPSPPNIHKQKAGNTEVFSFSCADDTHFPVKASTPINGSFTVSAWACPDGIPVEIENFAIIGKANHAMTLGYNREKRFRLDVTLADGKIGSTWTYPLPSDKWYFVTAVCDASAREVRMYVNGKMHHMNKLSAAPVALDTDYYFGCSDPKAKKAFWFNGLVNDLHLYAGAFQNAGIIELFEAESARYPVKPIPDSVFDLKQGQSGGFKLLPAFAENAVSETKKQQIRKELPDQINLYRQQVAQYQADFDKLFDGIECIQKERIAKRMEIVGNLFAFIEENLKKADNDGLLFAYNGLNDLKFFMTYFELEKNSWEKFPRLADAKHSGNNPTVYDVKKDFGAKGDGVTDDFPAFDKAVTTLKALGGKPAILRIPAGIYFFNSFCPAENTPASPGGCNLKIEELENAIIEGESPEKTELLFGRFRAAGLFVNKSNNVTVRNLTLRYQQTPFCQGTILEVDVPNSTVTIQHDAGTLTPDDQSFKDNPRFQCVTAYTTDGNLYRSQFITYNEKKADNLGNGKYRVHMDKRYSIEHLKAGLKFVIPNREGEYPCMPFGNTTLCTAENIHIRNSRAAAFQTWGGFWCTWAKCQVIPMPGMYLSSNADALITASGSYMSHFIVRSPGDDCFNANDLGFDVTTAQGNSATFPVQPGRSVPGNMLYFMSSATGQYLAIAEIKENSERWMGQAVNILAEPLPDTISSRQRGGLKLLTPLQEDLVSRYMIRYEEVLDTVYDTHQFGIGTVVSNNKYYHARAGINVQASCSLVEDNLFDNIPMGAAIAVSSLPGVKEGPAPYCVMLRNNTVIDAYFGVRTHMFIQNMAVAQCASLRGITFINTQFKDTVYALLLRNLDDTIFKNTTISGKEKNSFGERTNQVYLERNAHITFDGTSYQGRPLKNSDIERVECEANIKVQN